MSSACWTSTAVWTWGTNAGHLGYDKSANPVQVLPRKVTAISQPVIDVALSDYAMICLLDTFEVVCFHHDVNFRITFSTPRVLSDAFPFRPPQSTIKPMIKKVTSSGITFAALSSIGDVFTFTLPNPAEDVSKDIRDRHVNVKPQLIWALRKSFTAVKASRHVIAATDNVGCGSWIRWNGDHMYSLRPRLCAPTGQARCWTAQVQAHTLPSARDRSGV